MTITIGTISSATLRTEDLLAAFAAELDYQVSHGAANEAGEYRKLVEDAGNVDPESEEARDIVDDLANALNGICPSYVYFGAHEGDSSDFGFWPDIEALKEADEVLKINDLSEFPTREVMLVSDHGNVTYGYVDAGGFHEVWSCV